MQYPCIVYSRDRKDEKFADDRLYNKTMCYRVTIIDRDPDSEVPEKVAELEKAVMKIVDGSLGAIARPARVHFISGLPKTRSGKMLRRSIQALAEGRDPGDLTTIEDPSTLEQIKAALVAK